MRGVAAFLVACVSLLFDKARSLETPPVLPTSWSARTIDPPQPEGLEIYHFVDPNDSSSSNPSAHWFKYPGCEKLEYYTRKDKVITNDYYLGCYSVSCCYENRGSGIKEWQVRDDAVFVGTHLVESFGDAVKADGWSVVYHAFPERVNYTYWVTGGNKEEPIVLHRIDVVVRGPVPITTNIQYKDFKAEEPTPEFLATFEIPAVCRGNQVHACPEEADTGSSRLRSHALHTMMSVFV